MALESMTGFARASLEDEAATVYWELRSVNGRGLEARLRLPPGHERLEQPVKQRIAQRFSRGNIQASLTITREADLRRPVVDEEFLFQLAQLARRLHEEHGAAPARADGLLALRGVLEAPDATADEETRERLDALALAALDRALEELAAARQAEGASLGTILEGQLAEIEALTLQAEADPSRELSSIRARLKEQLRQLMDAAPELDEARLYQEAAFLATKADIREEIDRLKTHVASARALLAAGGPVGRKLDFLAQEFNREANTLCSKSNASSITAIGLELKAAIDRFREQLQNLE
ncbi:YicC family protein [Chelativorans sp. SCAU2101]|jgi:TIGR00255 family protein|uniref:YicC family protein n=1 Tax=Chelativorans petroleitrophicus TaxID=2975484 RepID=A0A9X2X8F2_9HYPH|nr:YicC/YloC family endoribonuclease [Chelativorans petroleitrophicus]MCT8990865.1 YicC family protein [Chelativorans petroleitrophicus]